jgi:hypothetical protein
MLAIVDYAESNPTELCMHLLHHALLRHDGAECCQCVVIRRSRFPLKGLTAEVLVAGKMHGPYNALN